MKETITKSLHLRSSQSILIFLTHHRDKKVVKIPNGPQQLINYVISLPATSRNDVERMAEETEEEDRLLLPDMKTSYVPVDTHPLFRSQSPHRRKRDIDAVLNLHTNSRRSQIWFSDYKD